MKHVISYHHHHIIGVRQGLNILSCWWSMAVIVSMSSLKLQRRYPLHSSLFTQWHW